MAPSTTLLNNNTKTNKETKDLKESGYPVLRVRNADVWQNLKTVIKDIKKALKEKP